MKKVAINGFGRIGRAILKSSAERKDPNFQIHLVNYGSGDVDDILHFLKYDSTHGVFNNFTRTGEKEIDINGQKVEFVSSYDIDAVNWKKTDVILECTGKNLTKESVQPFFAHGVAKVILSAPAKGDVDRTVVLGVNHNELLPTDRVISIGSCTTNCLAPIAKILHSNFGIESGFMTTVHAYTNDQRVLDSKHKDRRRARACAVSMIPTSTGAAKSLGIVIPELQGKLDGTAIRVPIHNVSLVDLTIQTQKNVDVASINNAMKRGAEGMKGILAINEEELVSIDFNKNPHSSIYDATQTKIVGDKMARVLAWYDNEWGFANRMLDVINLLS